MENIMKKPNHATLANAEGNAKSNLLLANKLLTIVRWTMEILTVIYIVSLVWVMQPGWQDVQGIRRQFVDLFLKYFPFNDVQMTWSMIVIFAVFIVVKYLLFKNTDFYASKLKFLADILTMAFWIAFSLAWIVMAAMSVVGEVFYFFNIIPYEWIPFINYMF
ncbi:MAG: hypothetical protein FWE07_05925 [Turicibacter sp.]|nr:hypothetical protein [Turicibacter sp.]